MQRQTRQSIFPPKWKDLAKPHYRRQSTFSFFERFFRYSHWRHKAFFEPCCAINKLIPTITFSIKFSFGIDRLYLPSRGKLIFIFLPCRVKETSSKKKRENLVINGILFFKTFLNRKNVISLWGFFFSVNVVDFYWE